MRTLRLLFFCSFLLNAAFCQAQTDTAYASFVNKIHALDAAPAVQQTGTANRAPSKLISSSAIPFNAGEETRLPAASNHASSVYSRENLCADSAFTRLIGLFNGSMYVRSVSATHDNQLLVSLQFYDSLRLPQPFWKCYGILVKMDAQGNITWLRQLEEPSPGQFSNYFIQQVYELENGDLICSVLYNNSSSSSVYPTIIYRFSASGNLLWQNTIRSSVGLFNSPPGSFTFFVYSATLGLNDDVILCGTTTSNNSSGKLETVVRLSNTGQLIWDANYGNHGIDGSYRFGAGAVKVFVENGQIILMGLSSGTNSPQTSPAITILKLNYANGQELSRRFFKPSYPDVLEEFSRSFTLWDNQVVKQSNGHFLFYGKLFSDFMNPTGVRHHYGVVEFDAGFNLVDAYTISSNLATNFSNNLLRFDVSGKAIISLFNYVASYEGNVAFSSFKNKQLRKERMVYYRNVGMPGNNGFTFLQDGGYAYVQSHFSIEPELKSYFEYRKMFDSDTASVCNGSDTSLVKFLQLNIIEAPGYYWLDTNRSNTFNSLSYNVSISDTLGRHFLELCRQPSTCDTVKVHGNPVVCGSSAAAEFTAFKRTACGAIVNWQIDDAAIDSMIVLTDSSVRIFFSNINWQGWLYASVPGASCAGEMVDSMAITLSGMQQGLNLGADTSLCAGNTILLNAGPGFTQYLWQDGSSSATLVAALPGTYHVTVTDGCGIMLSDTVRIQPASFAFNAGQDTVLCNGTPVMLRASPGFQNYQWSPPYQITSLNTANTYVSPLVDTSYIITAEKWPGCVVRDTVHITVKTSPSINLGADTSLCTGQSLSLAAGPGFLNYVWNTGAISESISVNQAGVYHVLATAANGCFSADTLRVLQVSPLPVFSLGADTSLCTGQTLRLSPILNNATYQWQDGSTGSSYMISQPGLYILAVTQQGCTGIDSLAVGYKPAPVVQLGQDSLLCEGQVLLLDAGNLGATYQWQNGSISPQLQASRSGNYRVIVNLNGCLAADTISLRFDAKPFFSLGKDSSICPGNQLILSPHINTIAQYLWQDGSTSAAIMVNRPGLYSLRAINHCGDHTDSLLLTEGLCRLLMPNVFTPNNDGINDLFRVKYPFAVKDFSMIIFNRYGQPVFETKDMSRGWDGRFKSLPQDTGAYAWFIHLINNDGSPESQSGTVILSR